MLFRSSIPGVQRNRVKIQDPDTGLVLFTITFPATAGDVQTLDLKSPPGGFPTDWAGMEIGKRYVVRIEGHLRGPNPLPQFISLPPTARVQGPQAGEGQITRSLRRVEYTPLVQAP